MRGKKTFLILSICAALAIALPLTGCGEGKDTLNLPEGEMKQLNSAGKTGFSGSKKAFAEKKPSEAQASKKFYVYADRGYFKNHFVPSGWMGDHGDINFNDGCRENPYSRRTCIRINYSAKRKQGAGWAGIYWQGPANNWGNIPGGYDLTGAEKLSFYARGEKGGEVITEFKMGGIQGEFSDSTSASIGPVVLTPEWEKYTIDLKNEDLSHVIGGFAFVVSEMENPDGAVFCIDEIKYE